MAPVLLVHHAANRGHSHPPCSLAALRACLQARAEAVEVDVQALADGDYALLHNALLEDETTGRGPVSLATAAQLRDVCLLKRGRSTGEPVATLSQVVALLAGWAYPRELQLDLKVHPTAPLSEEKLRALVRFVAPLAGRVLVSSTADWSLRRLRSLAPELALGFDPLLYLDRRPPDHPPAPPYRRGAYGYRDDHPLAATRWPAAAAYLEERAEALWAQAPFARVWYIRSAVLAGALDDGFDWIGFLHRRGVQVDAWTLDRARAHDVDLARRLVDAGVDRITTNNAPALAAALDGETIR